MGMHFLVSAMTRGGSRRFVARGFSAEDAVSHLRARLRALLRVTDEYGGLYVADEVDARSVKLISGPLTRETLARLRLYTADGESAARPANS
jgi:hypothetical protein